MSVLQTMQRYVDGCLSGEIPVCEQIRFACERHNRDLTCEDIYFDEAAAERVVKFIQLMKHVKGKWAGQYIVLEPWQVFFIGSVFGWKWSETGLRRFREANLTICRKNGKTLIDVAIDLYMLTEDREPGADIILAASKEDQAKELFGVALSMCRSNPDFMKYYGVTTTTESIRCAKNNSLYKFIIGKPSDGGNPHAGHLEEAHEHKSSAAYDVLKNGMGSREQPLLYIASTAGSDIKGFYYQHLEYCRKVVAGTIEDDTLFSLEYTIDKDDNWEDFEVWKKANPNMGVSVFESYLRSQYKKALDKVDSRTDILTKHLNVWNNSSTAWIDYRKWLLCGDDNLKIEDFKGQECWVGLDLASRVDLCSLMFVFKNGDDFAVFGKHYINSETANRPENQHYRTWKEEGWLTITEGAETDFTYIANDLKEMSQNFAIQELAYDPREASFLMQTVREWASFPCIEVSQGPVNFSEPMKVLEAAYLTQRLKHQNDHVLNWAASNVILKNSSNKLFYPAKRTKDEKIDPIVALIMALARAEIATPNVDTSIFIL
jgi:phage terminase large subunit-like protein